MAERTECEVLVVGAGPAGLAAAVAASSKGRSVVMIDENPQAGGQIWREMASARHSRIQGQLAALFQAKVRILSGTTVFDFESDDTACVAFRGGHGTVQFQKAVLATGARELFLPFPGWTLPGVFGVGGLQAMVKQGLPIQDKRVAIAGSGPLLLAVAKHLGRHGANVVGIFEQAPPRGMRELTLALWRFPSKLAQAVSFFGTVQKLKPGWWIAEAHGDGALSAVTATDGQTKRRLDVDFLACAYGLVPNTELAQIAGCRLENEFVTVDEFQRTSRERVFCAGEPVEIGGVDAAIVQGTIAGLAAAGDETTAKRYFKSRAKCHAFAQALDKAFPLRDEVLRLARPETLICRCEDISMEAAAKCGSFKEAKIQTRLGMGPCQGRICGAAGQKLFGWEAPTVRPPVVPVPLGNLIGEE